MINKIKIIVHNTKDNYLKCKNFQVIKNVLTIAELANCYIQKNKPWKTATYNIEKATTQITTGLWCGKICIGLLSPILPKLALKMKKILKINDEYSFTNIISELQPGKIIGKYERLFNRIKDQSIKSLIDLSYKNSKPYN